MTRRAGNATTLELNKAHWPVTVLGPGRRIGLWVQGCTHPLPRLRVAGHVAARRERRRSPCASCSRGASDVVGRRARRRDDQRRRAVRAAAGLARAARRRCIAWRREAALDFDILCYSGYPLKTLERKHAEAARAARRDHSRAVRRQRCRSATSGAARATSRSCRCPSAAARATRSTSMRPPTPTASACRRRSKAGASG